MAATKTLKKEKTQSNAPAKKILELKDVKKITPDLDLLNIIPENIAEKVEAIVFGKD